MLWEIQLGFKISQPSVPHRFPNSDSGTLEEQLVGCFLDHGSEGVRTAAPLIFCFAVRSVSSLTVSLLHFQMSVRGKA